MGSLPVGLNFKQAQGRKSVGAYLKEVVEAGANLRNQPFRFEVSDKGNLRQLLASEECAAVPRTFKLKISQTSQQLAALIQIEIKTVLES